MSSPRKRADTLLVERGLFESRARARAAIEAGLVFAGDKQVMKPSETIAADAELQAQPAHPYVSRGGVKLAGALERYPIEIEGHVCLDVGASTGGFTEVLLANGASVVFAIDVGRGQLHPSLRGHPTWSRWRRPTSASSRASACRRAPTSSSSTSASSR
jgi:23S rRNA (cytidine1920-2'-O)/16S rRNA (cytidine1409-2'-O)-methyltransferase